MSVLEWLLVLTAITTAITVGFIWRHWEDEKRWPDEPK
jgi:type VI protein secretion system component VasK